MGVKYRNKVNENKLDYEPWGYREGVGYQSEKSDIAIIVEKFFTNVRYNKSDEKIHFYNIKGEEKGFINVREFPSDSIKSTSYNAGKKILTIKYESGKVVELNLTGFINSIISGVERDITILSGTVEEIINHEIDLQNAAFSQTEYVWDEENNKMVINFYNLNNELKGRLEMFDTNDVGEIMIEAGSFN